MGVNGSAPSLTPVIREGEHRHRHTVKDINHRRHHNDRQPQWTKPVLPPPPSLSVCLLTHTFTRPLSLSCLMFAFSVHLDALERRSFNYCRRGAQSSVDSPTQALFYFNFKVIQSFNFPYSIFIIINSSSSSDIINLNLSIVKVSLRQLFFVLICLLLFILLSSSF